MTRNNTRLLFITTVIGFTLMGCSSTAEKNTGLPQNNLARYSETIGDSFERKRLSVLAGDLQTEGKRREIYKSYVSSPEILEAVQKSKKADEIYGGAIAGIIGDSASGEFYSDLGVQLQVGLMAFNLGRSIFNSMQTVIMQRGYVPSEYEGLSINDKDDAGRFLTKQLESSLMSFGKKENVRVSCITNECNGYSGTFEVDLTGLQGRPESTPEKVYVYYFQPSIWEERINPVRDLALGYKTSFGHKDKARGLYVSIWQDVDLDEAGNAILVDDKFLDQFEYQAVSGGTQITQSLLGQYILSKIYSNPYMIMAIDGIGIERIFYNGQVYTFNKNKAADEGFVYAKLNIEEALFQKATEEGAKTELSDTE